MSPRRLSAARIAELAADIVIPADDHGPAAAAVGIDTDGSYRIYFGLDGGIRRSALVGPAFARPGDACALSAQLNARWQPSVTRSAAAPEPERDLA